MFRNSAASSLSVGPVTPRSVGVQGNGGGFVTAAEMTDAIGREAGKVRRDLAKNLEFNVGGLGGR